MWDKSKKLFLFVKMHDTVCKPLDTVRQKCVFPVGDRGNLLTISGENGDFLLIFEGYDHGNAETHKKKMKNCHFSFHNKKYKKSLKIFETRIFLTICGFLLVFVWSKLP